MASILNYYASLDLLEYFSMADLFKIENSSEYYEDLVNRIYENKKIVIIDDDDLKDI